MARSNGWLILLAGLALSTPAAYSQSVTPLQRLRERYPGVMAYEANRRIVGVSGMPMTSGDSPEAAAAAFLAEHGELFATELDLRGTLRARLRRSQKTVLGYRQYVQGIPVEGSVARILLQDMGLPGSERWRVASVAGKIADPTLPLPQRILTSEQALLAAQQDRRATGLVRWEVLEEVLIWEEIAGPQAVMRTWKNAGAPAGLSPDSWTFFVNTRTGRVERVVGNGSRFSAPQRDTTITGTVTGWATPGFLPDNYPDSCQENDPEQVALKNVLVQVIHNGSVFSSTYTDDDGDYSIGVPTGFSGSVRAALVGPEWTVTDWAGTGTSPPAPPSNFAHSCVYDLTPKLLSVTNPGSVVDFDFNTTSQVGCDTREFCTATVNTFLHIGKARDYLLERVDIDYLPCVDAWINYPIEQCGSRYAGSPGLGIIFLGNTPTSGLCANRAYSTIITHEYGHHIIHAVLGLNQYVHYAIQEGGADVWSMFINVTPEMGLNAEEGCSFTLRNLSTQNVTYPACGVNEYERGKVLGRAWWDIWCNLGEFGCNETVALESARDLHVAWMFISTGDQFEADVCNGLGQAAAPSTLIEVLTADDNDANLANGTPNMCAICDAFASRNIFPPSGYSVCGCTSGNRRGCVADCDNSTGIGVLDAFDFACFMKLLDRREPSACNLDMSTGPSVCDVFDFLAFQNAYYTGCPCCS